MSRLIFCIISECLCKCKHGEDLDKCDIRGNLKTKANQRRSADFINYSSSASPPKPKDSNSEVDSSIWKPLLLIIPLRLGLTETNVVYVESLKVCRFINLILSLQWACGKFSVTG